MSGERLSVDPANANTAYFGSINEGLWRTTNGIAWKKVSGIPSGTSGRGIRQVLFDTQSGTIKGQTKRIYVFVDGAGVYKSENAGGSWQNISFGSNANFYDAEISKQGVVYTCGTLSGKSMGLRRYATGKWTNIASTSAQTKTIGEIAIDPFNENRILTFSSGFSETARTLNATSGTVTWAKISNKKTAPNIPWMAWSDVEWFSMGEVVFDTKIKNKVWIAHGVGTWNITDDSKTSQHTWVENSAGQEHMVSNDLVALPDDKVVTSHWDRKIFFHEDMDEYPETHHPNREFGSAWDMDQSPQDPNFLVAVIEDHRHCGEVCTSNESGFSTDGGRSWNKFESLPPGGETEKKFGNLAINAKDKNNIVWLRGNSHAGNLPPDLYYTTNRGKSWKKATLPGADSKCCLTANFHRRSALTADRVLANTFYIHDYITGNIYTSSNKGATWKRYNRVLPAGSFHNTLIAVPGKAGHLLWSDGHHSAHQGIDPAMRSTDGGKTWKALPGTDKVIRIATGKPAPESTYPTIFIQGEVKGDFGYHMSIDQGNTWQKIGENPTGIFDRAKVLKGDMNVFGRLYVGFAGNGFVYYNHNGDVLPPTPPAPPTASESVCKSIIPPTIDGEADTMYEVLPMHTPDNSIDDVDTDKDVSGSYKLTWDDKYLYILATVTDDKLVNDSEDPWDDDSIEIYLDGGNEKATSYDTNDHQLVFRWDDPTVYHPSNKNAQNPKGIDFDQITLDKGYQMEIRIAWSFIGVSVEDKHQLGFDLHINDDDTGAERDGKRTHFDNTDTAYADTSVFGTFSLSGASCPVSALKKEKIGRDVLAFPNPATDRITVVGVSKGTDIRIIDLSGRTRIKRIAKSDRIQIDVRTLSPGLYFLKAGTARAVSIQKK